MKPAYFPICRTIVTYPNQRTITELRNEKGIQENASF